MKNIIVLLFIFVNLVPSVFSQGKGHKFPSSIEIVGKLVAYDFSESQMNMSSAPSRYTLIIEVLKPKKVRGKSKYLKVIYRSFGTEDVKDLFFSDIAKLIRLKLSRQNGCDSSLLDLESDGSVLVTDANLVNQAETSKLKIVGLIYFHDVPDLEKKIKLPCYQVRKSFTGTRN